MMAPRLLIPALVVLVTIIGLAEAQPSPAEPSPAEPSPAEPSPAQPAQPRNYRFKNGIRLAGGAGSKGRLEVSSKDSWFSNRDSRPAWSAVCDSASFDDNQAQVMCNLLDYQYGRKYYNQAVAALKVPASFNLVGQISCTPAVVAAVGNRRLLRGAADVSTNRIADDVSDSLASDDVNGRSLYTPLMGTINTPSWSPYSCSISAGPCDSNGPLVGIECSHEPLSPSPSPPPEQPSPPPAAPASSAFIRMVGGLTQGDAAGSTVERNLCSPDSPDGFCDAFGRVEVQVEVPGMVGPKIWAPLCAPPESLASFLGYVVCEQVYDWPLPLDGGIEVVVSDVTQDTFAIPQEPVTAEGDFNPSNYGLWATVVGAGDASVVKKVQDMEYEVSTTQCDNGAMMAVRCQAWT